MPATILGGAFCVCALAMQIDKTRAAANDAQRQQYLIDMAPLIWGVNDVIISADYADEENAWPVLAIVAFYESVKSADDSVIDCPLSKIKFCGAVPMIKARLAVALFSLCLLSNYVSEVDAQTKRRRTSKARLHRLPLVPD
jgi:hypothetical protein